MTTNPALESIHYSPKKPNTYNQHLSIVHFPKPYGIAPSEHKHHFNLKLAAKAASESIVVKTTGSGIPQPPI